MDQNTTAGAPMPEEKTPVSSIISIIVIVLVLALGALYFLKQVPMEDEGEIVSPTELSDDSSYAELSTQGTSTNLTDIEKDLNATNLSGVDAGLSNIAF